MQLFDKANKKVIFVKEKSQFCKRNCLPSLNLGSAGTYETGPSDKSVGRASKQSSHGRTAPRSGAHLSGDPGAAAKQLGSASRFGSAGLPSGTRRNRGGTDAASG